MGGLELNSHHLSQEVANKQQGVKNPSGWGLLKIWLAIAPVEPLNEGHSEERTTSLQRT